MTQTLTRTETRVSTEFDPNTKIVHLRDPWDGFTFATTLAGVPEQLEINPNLIVVES